MSERINNNDDWWWAFWGAVFGAAVIGVCILYVGVCG